MNETTIEVISDEEVKRELELKVKYSVYGVPEYPFEKDEI